MTKKKNRNGQLGIKRLIFFLEQGIGGADKRGGGSRKSRSGGKGKKTVFAQAQGRTERKGGLGK